MPMMRTWRSFERTDRGSRIDKAVEVAAVITFRLPCCHRDTWRRSACEIQTIIDLHSFVDVLGPVSSTGSMVCEIDIR